MKIRIIIAFLFTNLISAQDIWTPIELPKSYNVQHIIPSEDSTFYIVVDEDFKKVLYKTVDNGYTMTRVGGGVTRGFGEVHYNDGTIIVESNDKIYISFDEFKTYKSYSISSIINSSNDRVHQLQTNKDGNLYYILDPFSGQNKLYRFGTLSQIEIKTNFIPIKLDFDNDGNMYCKSASGDIHKSTDKGNTWNIILDNDRDNILYTDKSNSSGRLYVNSVEDNQYSYILYSDDSGDSWDTLGIGDFKKINTFSIYNDSTIYFEAIKEEFDNENELYMAKIINQNDIELIKFKNKDNSAFNTYSFSINSMGELIARFGGQFDYKTFYHYNNSDWIQTKLTSEGFSTYFNNIVDNEGNIYCRRYKNGIYRYNNSTSEWDIINNISNISTLQVGGIVNLQMLNDNIIATNFERTVKSSDKGITWFPMTYEGKEITSFEIREDIIITYTDDNIIISSDIGESWTILASLKEIDNLKYQSGIKGTYKFGQTYLFTYGFSDSLTTYISNNGKDWSRVAIDESIKNREFFEDEKGRILFLNRNVESHLSEVKRSSEVVDITESNDIPKYNKNNYGEFGIDNFVIGPQKDIWVLGQKEYTPAIGNRLYKSNGIDGSFEEIKLNGDGIWEYSNLFFSPSGLPYLIIDDVIYKGGKLAPWEEVSDFSNKEPSSINSLANLNGNIWFSSSDKQVYNTSNNGENWIRFNEGLVDPIFGLMTSSEGDLYSNTQFGVFRYEGNNSWKHSSFGMPIPSAVYDLQEGYNGNLISAVFGHGIFSSENNGNSWEKFAGNIFPYVRSVTTHENIVFAITNQGVYRTDDNVTQWVNISNNLGNISGSLIYYYDDYLYLQTENDFVKTKYNDIIWQPMDINNAQLDVNSLYTSNSDELFACTNNGLYKLNNDGDWDFFGLEGFGLTAMTENSDYYFVSTSSKVYRSAKSISSVSVSDVSYNIFPNPAKDELCIDYNYQKITNFRVFNLNQKLLLNGSISKNDGCIDISNLSTGVYMLLIDGKFVKFIKY